MYNRFILVTDFIFVANIKFGYLYYLHFSVEDNEWEYIIFQGIKYLANDLTITHHIKENIDISLN